MTVVMCDKNKNIVMNMEYIDGTMYMVPIYKPNVYEYVRKFFSKQDELNKIKYISKRILKEFQTNIEQLHERIGISQGLSLTKIPESYTERGAINTLNEDDTHVRYTNVYGVVKQRMQKNLLYTKPNRPGKS